MSNWVIVYRLGGILLAVLCVVALTFVFLPKCRTYQELQAKKAALVDENATLEAAVKKSQTLQNQFQSDPAFVERVAREQGMAKPGETVFKVTRVPTVIAPAATAAVTVAGSGRKK